MSMFVLQFVWWKCLELNASCLHYPTFRTRLRFICGDLTGLSPALFPVIRLENLRKKFLRTRNLKVMATRLCMRIKWVVRRSPLMETNCYKTDKNIRKSNSSNKGHMTQDTGKRTQIKRHMTQIKGHRIGQDISYRTHDIRYRTQDFLLSSSFFFISYIFSFFSSNFTILSYFFLFVFVLDFFFSRILFWQSKKQGITWNPPDLCSNNIVLQFLEGM